MMRNVTPSAQLVPDVLATPFAVAFWVKHFVNPWNGSIEYGVIGLHSTSLNFDGYRFSVQFASPSAGGADYVWTIDGGPTLPAAATLGQIQSGVWHHVALTCDGAQTVFYLDGNAVGAPGVLSGGTGGGNVHVFYNATSPSTEITSANVAIDSLTFFSNQILGPGEILTLYNAGVPLDRDTVLADPMVTAYYPGEMPTGALRGTSLREATGLGAPSLDWNFPSTDTYAPVLDPDTLSTPQSSPYTRLAERYLTWNAGASALDGRYALGSGQRIDTAAPGLLPYPYPGWGLKTTSASWFGAKDAPQATPILLASSTDLQQDPLAFVNAAGTLQYVIDRRTVKIRKPVFVSGS
jgi:hypothetical protein